MSGGLEAAANPDPGPARRFARKSSGQLKRWRDGGADSDGELWQNVLSFFGQGSYQYKDASRGALGRIPDSTPLEARRRVRVRQLYVWVSLGYLLTPDGALDPTGTCLDTYGLLFPKCRLVVDRGSGFDVPPGWDSFAPSSGLSVHAIPSPLYLRFSATSGNTTPFPEDTEIPLASSLFQIFGQPLPMSYSRQQLVNEIPEDLPLELEAGTRCNLQMRFEELSGLENAMFEFDCSVLGVDLPAN